jgi:hypothetical protein
VSGQDGQGRLLEARVHLLTDQYLPRTYFTMCGELLAGSDLVHVICEGELADADTHHGDYSTSHGRG